MIVGVICVVAVGGGVGSVVVVGVVVGAVAVGVGELSEVEVAPQKVSSGSVKSNEHLEP